MGAYSRSTLLFAESSFSEGAARAVDLWGFLGDYNYSQTAELADFYAMRNDWYAVGDDLRNAVDSVTSSK